MQLKPNTGLFLNNLKNTFTLCNSEIMQFVIIEYKEEYFKQSIFNASFQEYLTNTLNLNDRITFTINSKIESILTEVLYPKKGGLCQFMHLNNNVFDLLSIILNFSELTEDHNQKHAYHVQLEKVRKTIDQNLNIQYSIDVLSKIAGLNTSYLKKYFKEAYSITLFEYAKKKRIKYAKNLLTAGNLPVSAIAEKIGYQQASHFSFAFKKSTGFTPIQYRKTQ